MDIDDGATSVSSTSTRGRNRARPIDHVAPEDLPAGRVIASWPMVDCAGEGCTHTARWRDCFEECVYTRVSGGVLGDDDDEFHVAFFCYRCMAVRSGCTEADAMVRVRGGRRDVKRRREQNEAFNVAAATVVAAVPGITGGQRRVLAVDYLKEAMGPLARFVRIKTKMLKQRSSLLETHSLLMSLIVRMSDALQLKDVLGLIPWLDAIEKEVDKASEPIAFRGRGEDQWAFCLAADYADEWCIIRRPDGSIQCAFRNFHKCMPKAGDPKGCCGTVIVSKAWSRKLALPWATGQRWYCNCCTAAYKTTMGMLTEIHSSTGAIYWIVSSFPGEMNDVKWMAVEEKYGAARSPEDLYNRIPTTVPYTGDGFLRPAVPADAWNPGSSLEGVYKVVDIPLMRSMAVWSHLEMVAFAEAI